MIIDSHMHIGKVVNQIMTENMFLSSMEKYNIDLGIFSAIEIYEKIIDDEKVAFEKKTAQREANNRALDFVKNNKKIKAQFWIKPKNEGYKDWIEKFLVENRDEFCSLKLHPVSAHVKVTDPEVKPYIDLARRLKMPIACHTSKDDYSLTKNLYQAAKENPDIDFIAVHMGLETDNEKSIDLISKLSNLYGDTTWVAPEKVLKAIKVCGSHKILFGTDAPIDGIDTFEKYYFMIEQLYKNLSQEEFDNVMYKNAIRVFNLNNI